MTHLPGRFPTPAEARPLASSADIPVTQEQAVLIDLLYRQTGQTLTPSRAWRIETTLMPILAEYGLTSIADLTSQIASGLKPTLERRVVDALLNNETYFFRDTKAFDVLAQNILPAIAEAKPDKTLRIWCSGCSTGQEVYSLAMAIAEQGARWGGWNIDILGTDFSDKALQRATDGVYSQFEVQRGLSMIRLVKFFDKQGDDWRVKDSLRRHIRFAHDNLVRGRDHGKKYDLVLCRNVLIYFSQEGKQIAFNRFARVLDPGGLLMLGAGETIMGEETSFKVSSQFPGVYERAATRYSF